jgi:hypothetical protein
MTEIFAVVPSILRTADEQDTQNNNASSSFVGCGTLSVSLREEHKLQLFDCNAPSTSIL